MAFAAVVTAIGAVASIAGAAISGSAEAKSAGLSNRQQKRQLGLQGIDRLAEQRKDAEERSRKKLFTKQYAQILRGGQRKAQAGAPAVSTF